MTIANEIKQARTELEPYVKKIKGLIQLWAIFRGAFEAAKAYSNEFDQLSMEARIAFTKNIVVDYAKPWSGNKSPVLKSLNMKFLSKQVKKARDKELLELRNKMVGHIDEGFEEYAVVFGGKTISNNPRRPNTLPEVFVPLMVRAELTGAIWWIKEKKVIKSMQNHIEDCATATGKEFSDAGSKLRDVASKHAHVLNKLNDLINIRECKNQMDGTSSLLDINEGAISAPPPKEVKLGRVNLLSSILIRETIPPKSIDVSGNGFIISVPAPNSSGKTTFTVTFPPKKKKGKDFT